MEIIHIETQKRVRKTKKELRKELAACKDEMSKMLINEYKCVPSKEPTYIVEMTSQEFQLVSFYLELEKRKPIMNVKVDTELKKESDK